MTSASTHFHEHSARTAARQMTKATLATGVLLGIALTYAAIRAAADRAWFDSLLVAQYPEANPDHVGSMAVLMVCAWIAAEAAALAFALHAVWRTFSTLANGALLDPLAGLWLRRAGIAFATTAALVILAHPVLSLAISLGAPAGQRFVTFAFGSSEILTLFIAGVLIALGHVLSLAAEVGEDSRQIV